MVLEHRLRTINHSPRLSLHSALGISGMEEDIEDQLLGLPVVSIAPFLFLTFLGRWTL